MSEIRCIYSAQPKFPATDQHPDAVRYQTGNKWVDAIGEPMQAEIDAILAPVAKTASIEEQFVALKEVVAEQAGITVEEVDARVEDKTTVTE